MDDGKIKLKVLLLTKECILTKVINGGVVTHRRGINLPGIDYISPQSPRKDRGFIKLGIEEEVNISPSLS
jgi:pyruvate kinase